MKIEQSEMKDQVSQITLTIERNDCQEAVDKELRKLRQKANIPGFRPGMVPFSLIKKMYGKGVLADTLNKTINEQLNKYIEDNQLNVLGDPMPNEELSPTIDLDNEDNYTFVFDVAIAPDFDATLNAKNKLTQYQITVTDEMVQNQVNAYAERFGEYIEAEEVQEGDVLKGLLKEIGNEQNPMQKENAMLNPQYMKDKKQQKLFLHAKKGDVISFNPMKAFDSDVEVASLLGMKKEEVKDLKADFTFEIQSITRHIPAKIDGELFAKIYGENNVKDEEEFRANVRQEITDNMAQDTNYKFGMDVKETIMKKMEKVSLPEAFLKRWVKTTNKEMTDEQLEKDFPAMVNELKWHLAKNQLMKKYDIKVEKEDVEAYAKEVAKIQFMQYGLMHVEEQFLTSYAQEMLKKEDQLRGLVERVAENKIYEAIKGAAKIEQKTVSHEEFNKLFS